MSSICARLFVRAFLIEFLYTFRAEVLNPFFSVAFIGGFSGLPGACFYRGNKRIFFQNSV